jgi:hypothetical protein
MPDRGLPVLPQIGKIARHTNPAILLLLSTPFIPRFPQQTSYLTQTSSWNFPQLTDSSTSNAPFRSINQPISVGMIECNQVRTRQSSKHATLLTLRILPSQQPSHTMTALTFVEMDKERTHPAANSFFLSQYLIATHKIVSITDLNPRCDEVVG